jgi:hypothetical protein
LRTQVSDSASAGRAKRPVGRSIAVGAPDAPAMMSTSSPVAVAIRSAAWRTRSRLSASIPVTPATRTRTAEIARFGSKSGNSAPPKARAAPSVVSSAGGCAR